MLNGVRARLTYANVMATTAFFIAIGGSAYAGTQITGGQIQNNTIASADILQNSISSSDIKNGDLLLADFKKKERSKLRGPAGAPGATGATGATGAVGATGAAGDSRAFGFVDNSSGSPVLSKSKGAPQVRRSGNGVFCITVPGVDPTITAINAVASAKSGQYAVIFVGSGLAYSQQCTNSEFQVLTVSFLNADVGVNNASFEFIVP